MFDFIFLSVSILLFLLILLLGPFSAHWAGSTHNASVGISTSFVVVVVVVVVLFTMGLDWLLRRGRIESGPAGGENPSARWSPG